MSFQNYSHIPSPEGERIIAHLVFLFTVALVAAPGMTQKSILSLVLWISCLFLIITDLIRVLPGFRLFQVQFLPFHASNIFDFFI